MSLKECWRVGNGSSGGEGSGKVIAKHSVGFDRRAAGQGVGPGAG